MTWLHLTIALGCALCIIEQALPIFSTLNIPMTVTVFSLNDEVMFIRSLMNLLAMPLLALLIFKPSCKEKNSQTPAKS